MRFKILSLLFATALTSGIVFTACQSSATTPEEEAAQNKVDDAKDELKAAEKAATAEEWALFKSESETKIRVNEISIADFKDKMSMSGRKLDVVFQEKIDALEKQNESMKDRIYNYEKRQSNWESFKSEFNHDIDEIAQALKDLTVNNTK